MAERLKSQLSTRDILRLSAQGVLRLILGNDPSYLDKLGQPNYPRQSAELVLGCAIFGGTAGGGLGLAIPAPGTRRGFLIRLMRAAVGVPLGASVGVYAASGSMQADFEGHPPELKLTATPAKKNGKDCAPGSERPAEVEIQFGTLFIPRDRKSQEEEYREFPDRLYIVVDIGEANYYYVARLRQTAEGQYFFGPTGVGTSYPENFGTKVDIWTLEQVLAALNLGAQELEISLFPEQISYIKKQAARPPRMLDLSCSK